MEVAPTILQIFYIRDRDGFTTIVLSDVLINMDSLVCDL